MDKQDKTFMRLALAQGAYSKKVGDIPFGAVVVQNGKVIAVAHNSEHTDQDVTKHAEVKAISEASKFLKTRDLSGCTLYSTTEPCTMCSGAILYACVKRLVFGMSRDDLPHLFRPRAIRLSHLAEDYKYIPEIVSGVLRQEVIDAFLEYKEAFRVKPPQACA